MEVKQVWERSEKGVPMKFCERCGNPILKRKKDSAEQWKARKYCSLTCINKGRIYKAIERRIMDNIEPIPLTGCWIWMGATDNRGHGYLSTKYRQPPISARRVIYEHFRGDVPSGQLVISKCGVELCVNPAHLACGTRSDCGKNMVELGRMNPKSLKNLKTGGNYAQ